MEEEELELLDRVNALLRRAGQQGFQDVDELKRLSCSMFVFLFESFFQKLEEIERRPRFRAEYAYNADCVITALSQILGTNLSRISGAEIAEGNIDHIGALLDELEDCLALGVAGSQDDEQFSEEEEYYNSNENGQYSDQDSDYLEEEYLHPQFTSKRTLHRRPDDYESDFSLSRNRRESVVEDDEEYDDDVDSENLSRLIQELSPERNSRISRRPPFERSEPSDDDSLGDREDDYFERIVEEFPQEGLKRQKQFDAIKSLARHRHQLPPSEEGRRYEKGKHHDKRMFRDAYHSLIEEERRRDRVNLEKRKIMEALAKKRVEHDKKVENLRIQRLADQLARESESRRFSRKMREDKIVKAMFDEALAIEKERVLKINKLTSEEQARLDKEALAKYEAAKKVYEDQKKILDEELDRKKATERQQKKNREEELRRMSKELKQEFDRKLTQARVILDAREERVFQVNASVIESAFRLLSDSRGALYEANAQALLA